MVISTPLTADALLAVPESERGELIRGEVRPVSPAGYDRFLLTGRLTFALQDWARETGAGPVGGERGCILARDHDTVLGPDIAFSAAERAPARGTRGFLQIAPDFAVEVLSPSNLAGAILEKVRIYLAAGVRLVWIVDPAANTVAEYTPDGATRWLTSAGVLDGGDVLPGFSIDLAALFA